MYFVLLITELFKVLDFKCPYYWMEQTFGPQSGSKLVQGIENPQKLGSYDLELCQKICLENQYCEGVNMIFNMDDTMSCYLLTGFQKLERYCI